MATREIRVYGDPVLRKRAEEVTEFGEPLAEFARDMVETMIAADDGVGLAATQVGVLKRFLVIGLPEGDDESKRRLLMMANPEILNKSEELETMDEGCLSLPGVVAEDIERPGGITVRFQKLDGEEVEMEVSGFLARVIQHELDHLNGVMIVDHLPPLKRSLLRGSLKRLQKQAKEAAAARGED